MIQKLAELAGFIKKAHAAADLNFNLIDPFDGCDWNCLANRLADFLLIVGGPLTAIMALVGGFQMITSVGNPEKFSAGKKTLLYAAIGFVVLLLAKGVTKVIYDIFK